MLKSKHFFHKWKKVDKFAAICVGPVSQQDLSCILDGSGCRMKNRWECDKILPTIIYAEGERNKTI